MSHIELFFCFRGLYPKSSAPTMAEGKLFNHFLVVFCIFTVAAGVSIRWPRKNVLSLTDLKNVSEPVREKTNNLGFRPAPTQTSLYSHRSRLDASNFGFKRKRYYTIYGAKTKALISRAVTARMICGFVFACANCWFSHAQAQVLCFSLRKLVHAIYMYTDFFFFFFSCKN